MSQLKFVVLDEEDLEVVSAHLQDAVAKVADVLWRPNEKRLVLGLNRFDWQSAQGPQPEYRRHAISGPRPIVPEVARFAAPTPAATFRLMK